MTDWRIKASIQTAISVLPRSAEINYVFQRRIAHTVPITSKRLERSVGHCREHLERFAEFGEATLADAVFFEFGAGWDLHLPLAFFALGVERQITIDLRRHARVADIRDVVRRLPEHLDENAAARLTSRPLPSGDDLDALIGALGIEYRAPADARATGLPAESVDCITSTSVLEHVPRDDIAAVLAESYRILKPGGICSFVIDLGDHFSRFDTAIPSNNFLRYAPRRWAFFNPDVAYQNRLRLPEYQRLFAESAFSVAMDSHRRSGFRALTGAEVHADFAHFSDEELAVDFMHVVLQKGSAATGSKAASPDA